MSTPAGQIIVSGTPTPQAPATFQVTAAGRQTQTQVGLIPSTSPYAFYQQVPVNFQPQGAIAGNALLFGGLTLAPDAPGWSLISSQGGPGYVSGVWELGTGTQPGAMPAQGAFYRSGSGGAGGGDGGSSEEDVPGNIANPALRGFQLSKTGWILLGLIATLILTDKD